MMGGLPCSLPKRHITVQIFLGNRLYGYVPADRKIAECLGLLTEMWFDLPKSHYVPRVLVNFGASGYTASVETTEAVRLGRVYNLQITKGLYKLVKQKAFVHGGKVPKSRTRKGKGRWFPLRSGGRI